jgi:hypothetical protein
MKFKDIVAKKTFQKDGVEKATWLKVGTMRETDDGKQFIELNMFPTTSFYVFEQKQKEPVKKQTPDDIEWEQ